MWLITVIVIVTVLYYSKGRNLKQRAKMCWNATKLILLMPTYIMFAITIITLIIFINNTIILPPIAIVGMNMFFIASCILAAMIVFEKYMQWFKLIEEKQK